MSGIVNGRIRVYNLFVMFPMIMVWFCLPLEVMFAEQIPTFFLGIWDLPEDEVLKRMIYGHRFWANQYSINTISYHIPPRELEFMDRLGTCVGDRVLCQVEC